MSEEKVNPQNKVSLLTKTKRRLVKFWPSLKKITVGLLIIAFLFLVIKLSSPLSKFTQKIFYVPKILFSVMVNGGELKKEEERTNFLIMGIGGGVHEGPDLTDTMIFVSLNQKTGDTVLLSIPRDIWVDSLEQKINTAYAIGEAKKKGGGLILAKASVSEIVGLPVHYAAVIDFNVFEEAINQIGGINVYIDRTFDDFKYPLEDKKWEAVASESGDIYEHLHFDKGLTHMDGKTALQFARSRNSEDEIEGTDFGRSKRQQKIIMAFKDKIISKKNLSEIPKLYNIAKTFQKNIDTDITDKNYPKLIRLALKFDDKKLRTITLDEGTDEKPGFLVNPPIEEYGAWVLAPRSGSWKEFQEYLKKELEKK